MTQPDAIEALTVALRADMDAVWQQILAEQEELQRLWPGLTRPMRVHRLALLQAKIRELADAADEIAARHVTGMLREAYEAGAWGTATVAATTAVFSDIDLDAITHLASQTMDDLLRATAGVRDSTRLLVQRLTRDHLRAQLYTGLTAEQAGVRLAADLADHGVTAITYTDGRRVGLSTYTDMVARTKSAEAYQTGGFNQGEELGIEWWEVMDGAACGWESHDDPRKADGMIVHLDDARRHPISHPNCRRATSPRPDISSAREAEEADPTPTEQQRADQRAAEEARAAAIARVPRRRTLDRQVARRRAVTQNLAAGTATSVAQQRHLRLAPSA